MIGPTRALSIMQPWASLICMGFKTIENRDWRCHRRGPIWIHAGQRIDREAALDCRMGIHPVTGEPAPELKILTLEYLKAHSGGILGRAEIVDCVEASEDPWFVGRYGIVMARPAQVEFRPLKGALGFFDPEKPWKPGGRLKGQKMPPKPDVIERVLGVTADDFAARVLAAAIEANPTIGERIELLKKYPRAPKVKAPKPDQGSLF